MEESIDFVGARGVLQSAQFHFLQVAEEIK
jgi:hypothetical protein